MKSRDRERAEREGFEDALEKGRPNPTTRPEHEELAYKRGFDRGKRAEERLLAKVRKPPLTL